MDVLAHALWVGVGLAALRRNAAGAESGPAGSLAGGPAITRRAVAATILLTVLPDLVHMLPVTLWVFTDGSWSAWLAFATATPGTEPALPDWVALWSHHLHCLMHSAVVAGAVTALCRLRGGAIWRACRLPLAGWWLHVVIDVFTHSVDFYPVPVLYPFSDAAFDGLAWNTPWFMALNYVALLATALWLWLGRRR